MKIGIDDISFYVPKYYYPLSALAKTRGIDPLKYQNGLLQNKMAIAPFTQDAISMGANAALHVVHDENRNDIDLVIFATESGVDYSKSGATYIHKLLGLKHQARAIELKQACYAGVAGLYFAKGHVLQNPHSKVLLITSDIARYGVGTDGEPTQGAGAVAMIIAKNPKMLVINDDYGVYTDDIYDFWRPNGHDNALVDGQYSNLQYKKFFQETYAAYTNKSSLSVKDFAAITFHIPYSKLGLRSLQLVAKEVEYPHLYENFRLATLYNREVGNIYTGSLFLSLISLLEHAKLKSKDRIGLFSYGSGAVAEFFSGTVVAGYKSRLHKKLHKDLLKQRKKLSQGTYENYISNVIKADIELESDDEVVQLSKIVNQQRIYNKKDTF